MCGNFFNPTKTSFLGGFSPIPGIVNGNFNQVRDSLEGLATLAGNYYLPGSSLITDNLVSKGAQKQLNTPLGMIANIGSGIAGSGVGSDFTGIPQSAGGALESSALTSVGNGLSDLGSNISSDLSSFTDSSGLSQLFGGTPQSGADLSNAYNAVTNTAPNLEATAGATAPVDFAPGGASTSAVAGAASPGSAGVGGGNLIGAGSPAETIGEPSFVGSSQGGAPIGNTFSDAGAGIGAPPPSSGGISNLFSSPSNTGNYNFDINGNAAGASSYSPTQQFANAAAPAAAGGNSVSGISSLFGSNGANMLGGLLKAGGGYALNNNNSAGLKAEQEAAQQAAAGFQPYQAAGTQAENTLASLYGNNGTGAQTAARADFANTPGYQFQMQQGLNAINADAAAKGQTLSGNTMTGINNYAQGVASQGYNNYINQLQNMASGGMSAAGGAGNALLAGGAAQGQLGQNNATAQNNAVGTGLSDLFPGNGIDWAKILGNNSSANSGLLSMF